MRWDGTIGFPGGFVKLGEHPVQGLIREITEELGASIQVENADFLLANIKDTITMYFFAKEVTEGNFLGIEQGYIYSEEYGKEVD